MLQVTTPTIDREITPEIVDAVLTDFELQAIESVWEYRIYMNPRFKLRGKWFPRNLAWRLRTFWEDFKAGKRPVMLLECPPQHGKSMAVIDFIAWAIPIKGRAEASSLLQRDKVWNWLTDDVFSRFSEKSFFVYI